VSAAIGGGVLADLLAGRPVEVIHRGPWNATAALVGASVYAATAALGATAALSAPTGVSQAAAFAVVVGMRLAALRWGLQNPLPAEVGQKLAPRGRRDDRTPRTGAEDQARGNDPPSEGESAPDD
jgi:uncharacterized membrane protein YeiH